MTESDDANGHAFYLLKKDSNLQQLKVCQSVLREETTFCNVRGFHTFGGHPFHHCKFIVVEHDYVTVQILMGLTEA